MSLPPPATGWAGLPHDVLWSVFTSLGQHEVLQCAGLACAAWWRFARDEPELWRRIDLTPPPAVHGVGVVCSDEKDGDDYSVGDWMFDEDAAASADEGHNDVMMGWKPMARAAVDRSAGQCEAFCGRADDDVLLYLADRAPPLRSLRVTSYYEVSSKTFSLVIKKFPLLEELELVLESHDAYNCTTCREPSSTGNSWAELLQSTCQSCRHLNRFTVRCVGTKPGADSGCIKRESNFPKPSWLPTMHNLRSLVLCGNSFTKYFLLRIIDSCPNLELLDISKVSFDISKTLEDKLSWIKDLRLPSYYYDSDENDYCCGCSSFDMS